MLDAGGLGGLPVLDPGRGRTMAAIRVKPATPAGVKIPRQHRFRWFALLRSYNTPATG